MEEQCTCAIFLRNDLAVHIGTCAANRVNLFNKETILHAFSFNMKENIHIP